MFARTVRYTAIRISIGLLAMVTSILVYRMLGPSESGKLVLVMGLVRGIVPLISFGTSYALIRFVVNAPRGVSVAFYRRAVTATLAGLILLSGAIEFSSIARKLPQEIWTIRFLLILLVAGYGWQYLNNCMLRGLGRLNMTSLIDGALELVPGLLILPWLIAGFATFEFYLELRLIVAILVSVFTTLAIWHILSAQKEEADVYSPRSTSMGDYLTFVVHAQIGWGVYWLFINVSPWIIRYLRSPYEVGLFGVAMRIPIAIINLLLTPLLTPLVYYLTAEVRDVEAQAATAIKGTVFIAIIIGVGTLFLSGNGGIIVPLLFGAEYQEAVPAFLHRLSLVGCYSHNAESRGLASQSWWGIQFSTYFYLAR